MSHTARTVSDRTRTPLTLWFSAVWHMTNQKNGISALGLQRELRLGCAQTAWHRLRLAMVRADRALQHREVEVDETLVGGDMGAGPFEDPDTNPLAKILGRLTHR